MLLAEVKKLKVAELRAMLSARGLDPKGLKAELVVRLISAIEAGVAPIKSGDEGGNACEETSTHSLVRAQSPVCTSKNMNAYADQSTQTDPPQLCSCTASSRKDGQQRNPQPPVSLATVATGEEDAESSSVLTISEPEEQDQCKSTIKEAFFCMIK